MLLAPLANRRFPRADGQGVVHHAGFPMVEAEQVAQLVFENGEQIHAVRLALVAGGGELGVVPGVGSTNQPWPRLLFMPVPEL
jgi:hypothetical protein